MHELLPQRIQELADVIGLEAALTLVKHRGGIRVYVPTKVDDKHWLVALIGVEAVTKLVSYYGGETIEIDRCHGVSVKLKHQAILAAANNGASTATLARAWNMTERGIRKVKERAGQVEADPTLDLFTFF